MSKRPPTNSSRPTVRERIVDIAAAARSLPLLGRAVSCSVCKWKFRFFTRGGSSMRPKQDGYCPRCNAKVRHRWLWLHLADVFAGLDRTEVEVLHIAPAHSTHRAFTKMSLGHYVTADKVASNRASIEIDLCQPVSHALTFDIVICVHVLEHLDDDLAGLQTLYELIRPGGLVVIGVPVRADHETLEDPTITDPADRADRFGESDHRRWYGYDIVERLEKMGFDVDARLTSETPQPLRARYGLTTREGLFLCRRADRTQPTSTHAK